MNDIIRPQDKTREIETVQGQGSMSVQVSNSGAVDVTFLTSNFATFLALASFFACGTC